MSEDQIDRRLERGSLHRIHRGVYAVGYPLLDRLGTWLAAVLACGSRAVLSHRSAGELIGILPSSTRIPEVTRPSAWRPRAGIIVHRAAIPEDETQVVMGIRTTGLSRTVLDLAVDSSAPQLEQVLNEAEVRGLTDRISIPTLLKRYPGRAGSTSLHRLFAEGRIDRGITRSELEERFRAAIDSTDLPSPRRNAPIAVSGTFFEVDCLWAEQRLIVELDGRATHGTRRAFERDRERDRLLQAEGWRVVRITWLQLRDEPEAVLADLRRMLAPTL